MFYIDAVATINITKNTRSRYPKFIIIIDMLSQLVTVNVVVSLADY